MMVPVHLNGVAAQIQSEVPNALDSRVFPICDALNLVIKIVTQLSLYTFK